jgi:DNA-binding response OmpR family regulator
LEAGATQFISKPFDSADLINRIQLQLQKHKKRVQSGLGYLQVGNLKIDPTLGKVLIDHREVHFSQLEFKLLTLLVEKAGALVEREEILKDVWNQQAASPRVIDPHIVSIRDKLSGATVSISSIYGKGYILKYS